MLLLQIEFFTLEIVIHTSYYIIKIQDNTRLSTQTIQK
jgi:hypothetical protein